MQSSSSRGFTLIELIVVMAIIGILTILATGFDFNKKTDQEKGDRINANISSALTSAKINMTTGKGIGVGTGIITPTTTEVLLSTGTILVRYYSGQTVIGTGNTLTDPFFGETGYRLESFYYYKNNSLTNTGTANELRILFDSYGNISFSGANLLDSVVIGLKAGYHSMLKTFEFDRRSGKITIK